MNDPILTRRSFVASTAAVIAAAPLTRAADPNGFSFLLLGDLHIDKPEHHDMDWVRRHMDKDVPQIDSYCKTTAQYTPKLLEAARRVIGESKRPVKFVMQIGDLVEGICGNQKLAERQCEDALRIMREANLGVPLFMVKGNHDVTGPGAAEAFAGTLLPFVSEQLQTPLKGANYTFEQEGRLFIGFDCYSRDSLDWAQKTLATRGERRIIFMAHQPVVPYNARSTWHVYSSPSQAARREKLLALLARHRAVVLTGHLHKYSTLFRSVNSGRLTQLAVSSVLKSEEIAPKDVRGGVEQYNEKLLDLEPNHSPETREIRRKWIEEERPSITQFDYADTAGFAMIHVGDAAVTADIYNGANGKIWKSVTLS